MHLVNFFSIIATKIKILVVLFYHVTRNFELAGKRAFNLFYSRDTNEFKESDQLKNENEINVGRVGGRNWLGCFYQVSLFLSPIRSAYNHHRGNCLRRVISSN